VREISAFHFRGASETGEEIKADFISPHDGKIFNVGLRKLETSLKVLKSCGDKERAFIPQYRLLGIGEA